MIFILCLIASIACAHIIVGSSIFGSIRSYFANNPSRIHQSVYQMLSCYECCGYWTGFFTFFIWYCFGNFSEIFTQNIIIYNVFMYSPIVSLLSDMTYRVKSYLCEECG